MNHLRTTPPVRFVEQSDESAADAVGESRPRRLVLGAYARFREDAGRVIRRYGWALLAPPGTLVLSVSTNALVSRSLGAEAFGAFAVGVTTLTLLGIAFGLGMPSALLRFRAAEARGGGSVMEGSSVSWLVVLSGSILLGASFLFVSTLASDWIVDWVPPNSGTALVLAAVGVALMEMRSAQAQSEGQFVGYFGALVGNGAFRLTGVALALALGSRSASTVLLGYGVASLVGNSVLAAPSIRAASAALARSRADLRLAASKMIHFGSPILLTSLLISAVTSVDTLIAASTLPGDTVGVYAAGIRLTIVQSTLIAGMTAIAAPDANRAIATNQVGSYVKRWTLLGVAAGVFVTAILLIASGSAVRAVYGPEFPGSDLIFRIATLGMALNFVGNMLAQLLYASGRARRMLLAHGMQLTALVLALPIAAETHGALGLVGSRAVINALTVIAVIIAALRVPPVHATNA